MAVWYQRELKNQSCTPSCAAFCLIHEHLFVYELFGGLSSMTLFDILVGVPLLMIYLGGWPALAYFSVKRCTRISKAACLGTALLVGGLFAVFILRFTASLPGVASIPLTPEQKTIERIYWLLIAAPYVLLSFTFFFRYFRKSQGHDTAEPDHWRQRR